MVKETLSVARVPSKVGGSFLIAILKIDESITGWFVHPDRTKVRMKVEVSFENILGIQISIEIRKNWLNN